MNIIEWNFKHILYYFCETLRTVKVSTALSVDDSCHELYLSLFLSSSLTHRHTYTLT